MLKIIFVRRQSPDWENISCHYRNGMTVDPAWFVPPNTIPGFPINIEGLIRSWNRNYSVDFFTFRAVIAALSKANINGITGSIPLLHDDPLLMEEILKSPETLVYFHDDDDFFSPDIASILSRHYTGGDAVVSPLFRLGQGTFTFVKPDVGSDYIWGPAKDFDMAFQSNNYALRASSFSKPEEILRFKDHVHASKLALERNLDIQNIKSPLSATVKTPASASVLKQHVGPKNVGPKARILKSLRLNRRRPDIFSGFIADTHTDSVPDDYNWIKSPLGDIRDLVRAIISKQSYPSEP